MKTFLTCNVYAINGLRILNSFKTATWPGVESQSVDSIDLLEFRKQKEIDWRLHEGDEEDFTNLRSAFIAKSLYAALRLSGLYQRGFRNATSPCLTQVKMPFLSIPDGLVGLRILLLSDLHLSRKYPEFATNITKLLTGVEADLCLIAGDYRFGHYGTVDHIYPQLDCILSAFKAPLGVYGVLGNHDVSSMIPTLQALGINILYNTGFPVSVGGETVWLAGCDDPHRFKTDHLVAALADAPDNAFKILLIHSPDRIEEAHNLGVQLYLCGHTHGGQIRIPRYGAVRLNAHCHTRFAYRQWHMDKMLGYTSPGLGTTDIPIRFSCPPEAQLITLARK